MTEHDLRPAPGRGSRFGMFEFDPAIPELRKAGRVVSLRRQPAHVLAELVSRPGEVISREDLRRALWGEDTFVDFDQGLNHAVRESRAALGDTADSPRFIQTLQRRGYRFIGPVTPVTPAAEVQPLEAPPSAEESARLVPDTPAASPPKRWHVWGTAVAVTILVGTAAAYLGWRSAAPPGTAQPSEIIVRPFASPDAALGAGIAHAIAARLGSQQRIAVRADLFASRAGAHALMGQLSTAGDEVTAVVWLEDTGGTTVWSQQIKVRADELFSLEDVIAERVMDALQLRLAVAEQERLRTRYTSNATAYSEYLRGRSELVKYTREGTLAAIAAFERALTHDPDYAFACAGLAMASADMCLRFAPSQDVERWGERAEAEARAALDGNPDLAEAHLARAAVSRKREFDWNATLWSARRAPGVEP